MASRPSRRRAAAAHQSSDDGPPGSPPSRPWQRLAGLRAVPGPGGRPSPGRPPPRIRAGPPPIAIPSRVRSIASADRPARKSTAPSTCRKDRLGAPCGGSRRPPAGARSMPAPCRRRRRRRGPGSGRSPGSRGRSGSGTVRGMTGPHGPRRRGDNPPRRRSPGARSPPAVQTSYGTVPIAMARSYSATASAHRPARLRSSARRIRNGMSAPRSIARARSASRSAVRPSFGEDLGPERIGQPVAGPGGDDAVEQPERVGRPAVGERSRRRGGPASRGRGRAAPGSMARSRSASADADISRPRARPAPRRAWSSPSPGRAAISRSRCQRAAKPSPTASASRAQASCQSASSAAVGRRRRLADLARGVAASPRGRGRRSSLAGVELEAGPRPDAADQPLDRLGRRLGRDGPGPDVAAVVHRQQGAAVAARTPRARRRAAEHPGGPIGRAVATSQRRTVPSSHPVAKVEPSGLKADRVLSDLAGMGHHRRGGLARADVPEPGRRGLVAPPLTVRRSRPSGAEGHPARMAAAPERLAERAGRCRPR